MDYQFYSCSIPLSAWHIVGINKYLLDERIL